MNVATRRAVFVMAGASIVAMWAAAQPPASISARDLYLEPAGDAGAAPAHPGLRYSVLALDPVNGQPSPADPGRVFHNGECVALSVEANFRGSVYILMQGSSGAWLPLLPSPEAAEEDNAISPARAVRVPARHCFAFEGAPGRERLFMLVTADREGWKTLEQAMKGGPTNSAAAGREVARAEAAVRGRDLRVKKDPGASASGSLWTYVVNASAPKPAWVLAEIDLEHRE